MLIFFYSFISCLILTPLGYIFIRNKKKNIYNYSINLIFGIILVSFLALILNFFFPLNKLICTLIIIIPIITIIKNINFFFSINYLKFLLIISTLAFLLIAKSTVYRPDAYLYHLPFINILIENKIIFGLTNLHSRFGHTSIIQYTSSILNNYIFEEKGILLPVALVASAVIINLGYQIFKYFSNQQYTLHFYYLFFIFIFITYKMNRYSEYGNDATAHFLFFFLISELIRDFKKEQKSFSNLLLISVFIIMNKITFALAIFLPFLINEKNTIKFFNLKNYFIYLFVIIWILKNIILTGCLTYPIPGLCFEKLSWTNTELARKVSIENEAWAKGWSDSKYNISQINYNKSFNWIKTWSNNHFKKIYKILVPYLFFIIFIYIYSFLKFKKTELPKKKFEYYSILIVCAISSIIWFLKAPVFRFGYSYIITFIALSAALTLSKIEVLKKINIFFISIIFCSIVFIGKNALRIFDKKPYLSLWPQIELKNKNTLKKINLEHIYYYESEGECGYGYSICTNYKNLKVKSIKKLNYIIIKYIM